MKISESLIAHYEAAHAAATEVLRLRYSATPVETSEAEGGMGCLTCSFMSCR